MSDILREAAALMRERAEGAAIGGREANWREDYEYILQPATAAHVASWPPSVALAVAGLLDAEARTLERAAENHPNREWEPDASVLAVANAYLGAEVA